MCNLLETNIYEPKGKVLICGTCLHKMQPEAYDKLAKDFDMVLTLCLERDHVNMAISKICGMLSTGNISELAFASVNKSPHCTQMHYIKREIFRTMDQNLLPTILNMVAENEHLYYISDDTIALSKDLVRLSELN